MPGTAVIDQPFRVLMIAASSFPQPRGSQVLIAGLAGALRQRGHTVQMATYSTRAERPGPAGPAARPALLPWKRRAAPIPLFWKPLLDLLLIGRATAAARQVQADVLHAHNFEGLLVGLWVRRRLNVPLVYHVHNLMEPELPAYFRSSLGHWAGRRLGRWVDDNLPRRADACIALDAEAVADLCQDGLRPEQIHVIPPGISVPEPTSVSPDSTRRRWGLGAGPLVLYSGNLDSYQDLPFLLRAFRRVRSTLPEAELVLATHQGNAAPHERSIRQSLHPGEHLLHVTTWAEMCELLAACDVAVSPRQVCWGFPIKLLNYMVTGRPIVAVRGSAQGLRHAETAWVVPNGDEAAFAEAILRLLQDHELANRLGRAARRDAEEHYSWPLCAEAVERVYRQVVAEFRNRW